jgi:hypothetical protein
LTEILDIADGLWLWRREHPEWTPHSDWDRLVTSFCVTSDGETLVIDPLDPADAAVWERLDALRPVAAVYLKPDHLRDVALFRDRYGATVYGEAYIAGAKLGGFDRFVQTAPGSELPGGIVLLDDGRWRMETPAYLPEQRALVFSDGVMCDPSGDLRVGTRRGTSAASCRRFVRSSLRTRSRSCWSRTATRSTRAMSWSPRSSARPGSASSRPCARRAGG